MGKQSRRRSKPPTSPPQLVPKTPSDLCEECEFEPDTECGVCMQTPFEPYVKGAKPTNSLACSEGHPVCMECVRKLIRPVPVCSKTCSGMSYTCPFCRANACLTPSHVLSVLAGSSEVAEDMLGCEHGIERFNRQRFERRFSLE